MMYITNKKMQIEHKIQYKSITILGAGWLGKPLATSLCKQGIEVKLGSRTIERLENIPNLPSLNKFQITVTDKKITGNTDSFLDSQVLIINIPPDRQAGGSQFISLLPLIQKSAVQRVILVSSTSVYAPLNQILEEDKGAENPESILYQSEAHFKKIGLPTTILRFAGLMGGIRYPGRFFKGKPMIKAGNTPVNMLHLNDAVGVILAVLKANCPNDIFNVCASTHPSRKAFYTKAMQLRGVEVPIFSEEDSRPNRMVSNRKVIQKLGYTFEVDDLLECLEQEALFF